MMSKRKKLFTNSLIFALGDIGSKGITLLLVPFYTFYFSQSDYGVVDITQVTINLLIPILSLSVFEAVLRYVMDNENRSEIFTTGIVITILSSFLILFATFVFYLSGFLKDIIFTIGFILILQLFQSLYIQFVRGIGEIRIYALNGLLMSLLIGLLNVFFIAVLNFGIKGYFFSLLISLIFSVFYLHISIKGNQYYSFKLVSFKKSKILIAYSIPLMPNSIMWWIINASSRYFILFFSGASVNGLYAVSSKIPSVLAIFNSIFFKAWQLSAIEEFNSEDKSKYYSIVFNYLQKFLVIITALILLLLKPLFSIIVGVQFYNAWKYVPFLLMAILFSSFSSFLGTNYIAAKETKGVFFSSVIGGIVNLLFNIITIPLWGAFGASISSMFSFLIITIVRWIDTKKYIRISYNYKNIVSNILLLLLEIGVLYCGFDVYIEIILQVIVITILIVLNMDLFRSIWSIFSTKFLKGRSL
ncbi:polysaccharide biosynthesis C-terminal domain-containing protein [Rossellomorea marisflavi]